MPAPARWIASPWRVSSPTEAGTRARSAGTSTTAAGTTTAPAMDQVSAWAGIHYFASRDGKGANSEKGNVLTWPEGNGWLVERLRERIPGGIRSSALAYSACETRTGAIGDFVDPADRAKPRVSPREPRSSRPPLRGFARARDSAMRGPSGRSSIRPGWWPT